MRRTQVALIALAALFARNTAAAPTPSLPEVLYGTESVATVEGARGVRFNPAAIGTRYPSELLFGMIDRRDANDSFEFTASAPTGALFGGWTQNDRWTAGLAAASGSDALRTGVTTSWIVDSATRDFVVDLRFGLLARPSRAVSLGATVDHLTQPTFRGERLNRTYQMGIGLRPLAIAPSKAHTFGTRFTLSADVLITAESSPSQARTRFGAEFEIAPGVALRAGADDHGGLHIGVGLLESRAGVHAQRTTQDGDRSYDSYAFSTHAAEDRSALAPGRDPRIGLLPISGELGDERLVSISLFGSSSTQPVAPIHDALDRALEDPRTRGVLIDLGGVSNLSAVEELRPRILALRAAGKPVVAYMQYGGGRTSLYLAAACDRIVASEEAFFAGLGLRTERRSYRSALAEYGVRVDRASIGRYKSAYRNFSVDSTTDADREVIEHNLDVVQEQFVRDVCRDRNLPRERLLAALDGRAWEPADLVGLGVIDVVGYREDARRLLGNLCALGTRVRSVQLSKLRFAQREWRVPRPIAVVYASGAIENGRSSADLLSGATIGDQTFTRQMEQAFRNHEVKAVVLRVDSPGGTTTASNLMLHAAQRLKRETKKPLIVSMGASAASGGYYLALAADHIVADRFTRTGSIGVLFVKPSIEGFYAQHNVRQEFFERGAYMRGLSGNADWDARLQAAADSSIARSYDLFVRKVVQSRGLTEEQVRAVAQGRVWLGEDARARGLVDSIGGLDEAIAEARRRAGVAAGEKIALTEYRRPRAGLIERAVGQVLREGFERLSLGAAATGEPLYLADDISLE